MSSGPIFSPLPTLWRTLPPHNDPAAVLTRADVPQFITEKAGVIRYSLKLRPKLPPVVFPVTMRYSGQGPLQYPFHHPTPTPYASALGTTEFHSQNRGCALSKDVRTRLKAEAGRLDLRSVGPLLGLAQLLPNQLELEFVLEHLPYSFVSQIEAMLYTLDATPVDGAEWQSRAFLLACLTSDVLHASFYRSSLTVKRLFIHSAFLGTPPSNPDLPALALVAERFIGAKPSLPTSLTDITTLIPAFVQGDAKESYASEQFVVRDLDPDERRHPAIQALNAFSVLSHPPYGAKSIVPTLSQFHENLEAFTGGLLRGVDLSPDAAVLGGSGVLACVMPAVPYVQTSWDSWQKYRRALLRSLRLPLELSQYIVDSLLKPICLPYIRWRAGFEAVLTDESDSVFRSSDFDLFTIAPTQRQAAETVNRLYTQVMANLKGSKDFAVYRTPNTLTIVPPFPRRHIQIVIGLFRSVEEFLLFSDLDCTALAYDGKNVLFLPRALRAFNTRHNFLDTKELQTQANHARIAKYAQRGFAPMIFEPCKHTIRCDVTLPDNARAPMFQLVSSLETRFNVYSSYNIDIHLPLAKIAELDRVVALVNQQALLAAGPVPGTIHHATTLRQTIVKGSTLADVFPAIRKELRLPSVSDPPSLRWFVHDKLELDKDATKLAPKCGVCNSRIVPDVSKTLRPPLTANLNDWVCPTCWKQTTTETDDSEDFGGKMAVVIGGRVGHGFQLCLRFLRLGATVITVTRFPQNAVRKFLAEPDSSVWAERLSVYGLDLRHQASVDEFVAHCVQYYGDFHVIANTVLGQWSATADWTQLEVEELKFDRKLAKSPWKFVETDPSAQIEEASFQPPVWARYDFGGIPVIGGTLHLIYGLLAQAAKGSTLVQSTVSGRELFDNSFAAEKVPSRVRVRFVQPLRTGTGESPFLQLHREIYTSVAILQQIRAVFSANSSL